MAEALDREPGQQAVTGEPGGDAVELGRGIVGRHAHRGDHHDPSGQLVAQDVLDHLQRRRVGPVQVVEDDQHGMLRRLGAQQLGDGLEQQVALDARVGAFEAGLGHELLQLREQQLQQAPFGGDPPPGLGRDGAQHGPHGFDHRFERDDRLGRRPAPQHDGADLVHGRGEPGGQA